MGSAPVEGTPGTEWAEGDTYSPYLASDFIVVTSSFQCHTTWNQRVLLAAAAAPCPALCHPPLPPSPTYFFICPYGVGWRYGMLRSMYFWVGTLQLLRWPRWTLRRDVVSLGLVKRNQINLQLDLVPFNQLQRRKHRGTTAPSLPRPPGAAAGSDGCSLPRATQGEEWVGGAGEKPLGVCKVGLRGCPVAGKQLEGLRRRCQLLQKLCAAQILV